MYIRLKNTLGICYPVTETAKKKKKLSLKEIREKKSFGENFRDSNPSLKCVHAFIILENLENVCIFFLLYILKSIPLFFFSRPGQYCHLSNQKSLLNNWKKCACKTVNTYSQK